MLKDEHSGYIEALIDLIHHTGTKFSNCFLILSDGKVKARIAAIKTFFILLTVAENL